MVNCTVTNNTATSAWGGTDMRSNSSDPPVTFKNCIIWGNSPAANQVNIQVNGGVLAATYSDIQQESGVYAGTGNINSDPLFVNPAAGLFQLQAGSPCVNTGDPASPLDLDASRADMGTFPLAGQTAVLTPATPARFVLHANAPNPFNPATTVRFDLPSDGFATLAVFDINGRLVRSLVGRTFSSGQHEVVWDGRDERGRSVASGVYVYRLTGAQGTLTRRMTLLR
jgi:hypothetical protein